MPQKPYFSNTVKVTSKLLEFYFKIRVPDIKIIFSKFVLTTLHWYFCANLLSLWRRYGSISIHLKHYPEMMIQILKTLTSFANFHSTTLGFNLKCLSTVLSTFKKTLAIEKITRHVKQGKLEFNVVGTKSWVLKTQTIFWAQYSIFNAWILY